MTQNMKDFREIYPSEFVKFRGELDRAIFTSYGMGEIRVQESKHRFCAILFLKLVNVAQSVIGQCPDPNQKEPIRSFMNFSSIAALARVLADTYVVLFHLGIEDCSDDEYQLRLYLTYWKDIHRRSKMGVGTPDEIAEYRSDLTARLEGNTLWASMDARTKRDLLKRAMLLHGPWEILERADFDVDECKEIYAFWSAHTHCDPVAFMRTGEEGFGVGYPSDIDLMYAAQCLEFTRVILEQARLAVDKIFLGAEARAGSVEGFNPSQVDQPPRPWAGKSLAELA